MGKGITQDWHLFERFTVEYTLGKSAILVLQSTHWLCRRTPERKWLMTNEEMQKAMDFIVEMDRRAAATLDRSNAVQVAQRRSEKRWKRTEARLHALLLHAKKRQRKTSAPRLKRQTSLKTETHQNTETDKRLQALAELVERQIRERSVGNS
jgi:hypothetical protein